MKIVFLETREGVLSILSLRNLLKDRIFIITINKKDTQSIQISRTYIILIIYNHIN